MARQRTSYASSDAIIASPSARPVTFLGDVGLGLSALAVQFLDIQLDTVLHVLTAIGGAALVWLRVCVAVREVREKRRKSHARR